MYARDEFVNMINRNHFVVLDTETTGLRCPAEICQIAILDFMGGELLNTFVKPRRSIPEEASRIHGITDETVKDAPSWLTVRQTVYELIAGKDVVIYNANYDMSMLLSSDRVTGASPIRWNVICDPICAMLWYADIRGEWNDYFGNNRWHKLGDACRYESVQIDYKLHDALGDCKMTYALIRAIMRKWAESDVIEAKEEQVDLETDEDVEPRVASDDY